MLQQSLRGILLRPSHITLATEKQQFVKDLWLFNIILSSDEKWQ